MLFRVCITLTPVLGGWEEDCEEQLLRFEMIEAVTFDKAVDQLIARFPGMLGEETTSNRTLLGQAELNRRTFR